MLSRRRQQYRYVDREGQTSRALSQDSRIRLGQVDELDPTDVFVCHDPIVLEAMRFIRDNIRQGLQIEDVAKHVNISRRTLLRRFGVALGRSVSSEIRRLWINEVKLCLVQTHQSIAEISSACGFSSTGQLSRFFKREVGVSPSEYRRGKRVSKALMMY